MVAALSDVTTPIRVLSQTGLRCSLRIRLLDANMLSLILVMVCAIAAGWLANRIHVPYPIVLVRDGE